MSCDAQRIRHLGHLVDEAASKARFEDRDQRDAMGALINDMLIEAWEEGRQHGDRAGYASANPYIDD